MTPSNVGQTACPGCGALHLDSDGPTHRYLGASAGCWELYGYLLAGAFPARPGRHGQLLVDAYAAQHPGVDGPQARQSVAVHLIALHARLADHVDVGVLNSIRVAGAQWGHAHGFEWLEPTPAWDRTILDVAEAADPELRGAAIDGYVQHVYAGWMDGFAATVSSWHAAVRTSMHRG